MNSGICTSNRRSIERLIKVLLAERDALRAQVTELMRKGEALCLQNGPLLVENHDLRAQLELVRGLAGRLLRCTFYQHSVAGIGHGQAAKCDTCDLCHELEAALEEQYKIRFGFEYSSNAYCMDYECGNCGNRGQVLIRKGVLVKDVELICECCGCKKVNITCPSSGQKMMSLSADRGDSFLRIRLNELVSAWRERPESWPHGGAWFCTRDCALELEDVLYDNRAWDERTE